MRRYLLPALAFGLLMPATTQAACCYFSARTPTSCSRPRRCSSRGTRLKRSRPSPCRRNSKATPSTSHGDPDAEPAELHEMPRDFFKHLAVYTIMRKREFAHSKLLPLLEPPLDDGFNLNQAVVRLSSLKERQDGHVLPGDAGGAQARNQGFGSRHRRLARLQDYRSGPGG